MFGYSDQSLTRLAAAIALVPAMTVLLGAGASSALAAPVSAPAWKITVTPGPTNFAPGESSGEDRYQVTAVNIGGAPTNGEPIVLSGTLPPGLTLAASGPAGTDDQGNSLSCSAGPPITCSDSATLQPGQAVGMVIPVDVAQGAEPSVTTEAGVQGGGAPSASASDSTTISATPAGFGFQSSEDSLTNGEGAADTQAGSHPYALTVRFAVNDILVTNTAIAGYPFLPPSGDARDVTVNLPAGVVVNPEATPVRCTEAELESQAACPPGSQVGTIRVTGALLYHDPTTDTGGNSDIESGEPLWNMVPPVGVPADFGFDALGAGIYVHLLGGVRTGSDYGLTSTTGDIDQKGHITAVSATLWGDPSDPSHNFQRGFCAHTTSGLTCPTVEPTQKPFLTLPSACSGPLLGTLTADSWQDPGNFLPLDGFETEGPDGSPAGVTGCELLDFSPSLSVRPEPESVATNSPSGLNVDVGVPQEESQEGLAEANLKDATVTLPAGMAVSPSAANGLGACGPAEIGLHNAEEPSCPDASKVGSVEVVTPLLEAPLKGSVFLARQGSFEGSLVGLYLVAEGSGVLIKLGGKVTLNAETGQVTATFANNPQLPFSELKLRFFGGPRAALVTPPGCGSYTATSQLTPYSSPTAAEPSSSFTIGEGCSAQGFAPSFSAGTVNNQAGGYTPFSVTFARSDSEQDLNGISVQTPPGLLGDLASVPLCGEAQANAGSCSAASQIGHTTSEAGPGSDPVTLPGPGEAQDPVYLTGPYNGQPFGLSIVVPAKAGPFNLGTVVVRASIAVDPSTSALTITSNPLPRILDGIPLQIRTVNVTVDRPGFTFNPTSCAAQSVSAAITSTQGAKSAVSSPFEAANCATLPFKPSFTASTQGNGTTKGNGASLMVKIAAKQGPGFKAGEGEANIAKVDTSLPLALSSRLTTLQKACTEAQFAANPAGCPAGSFVGVAVAHTPVLNAPLVGPAILVSHGGEAFPDLVLLLQGEGVEIVLTGHTQIKNGITYSRFETVPDAPVSSFELNLPEKENSILGAIRNLCKPTKTITVKKRVAVKRHGHVVHNKHGKIVYKTKKIHKQVAETLLMPTTMTGQNGAVLTQNIKVGVTGCPPTRKASKPAKKHTKKKQKKKKK